MPELGLHIDQMMIGMAACKNQACIVSNVFYYAVEPVRQVS